MNRDGLVCQCGCGFGSAANEVDPSLIEGIQQMESQSGESLTVTSGCRCTRHNRAVGGEPYSMHTYGKAADLQSSNLTLTELCSLAMQVPQFDGGGIGVYPKRNFLHVDVRGHRSRWTKE